MTKSRCCITRALRRLPLVAAVACLAALPIPAAAQKEPPPGPQQAGDAVTVVPGEHYKAGFLRRLLVGQNYRDLWVRPLRVEVLDLDGFAGGLTVLRASGNQSKTLHFETADGRRYIFRSIDKFMDRPVPPDVKGTLVGAIMQDHVSGFHPSAEFVTVPLLHAVGLLGASPVMYVMPDHPALGEHRAEYAGLLGHLDERPNEAEGDEPGFAESRKIVNGVRMIERMDEDPVDRIDSSEFLAARLIDFLVSDPDRGLDQWRWARFERDGAVVWRPISRDHDYAFMRMSGVLPRLGRGLFPKQLEFGPRHSSVADLMWGDQRLDRRLLTDLDKTAWDRVVTSVQASLNDAVIEDAVRQMPPEQQPEHADWLIAALERRRDTLHPLADAYYARLATEVDIDATDAPDLAEIDRFEDGTVEVRLYAPPPAAIVQEEQATAPAAENGAPATADAEHAENSVAAEEEGDRGDASADEPGRPYYQRRFRPEETNEVRVFLNGGDDRAVVRGLGARDITIRVIGGAGNDELTDASGAPSGRTVFYDPDDEEDFFSGTRAHIARVIERMEEESDDDDDEDEEQQQEQEESEDDEQQQEEPSEDWIEHKVGRDVERDWGSSSSPFTPAVDYQDAPGVIVGGGPRWTDYGFRKVPYAHHFALNGLLGLDAWGHAGGLGIDFAGDIRREDSPLALLIHVRATEFESTRFFGFGNDSPRLPDPDDSFILQRQVRVEPAVALIQDLWTASVGPVLMYTDPRFDAESPAGRIRPLGTDDFGQIGAQLQGHFDGTDDPDFPGRGLRVSGLLRGFPRVWDAQGEFARGELEGRGYVTLPVVTHPVLAVRAGVRRAWGGFPVHEAALIGGRTTLRGFRYERFIGDGAVYGSSELRVPVAPVEVLTRGQLGVLGFLDVGRVYLDGDSPGGWHTGGGAGVWFRTLGQTLNVVWAKGEENRIYLGLGSPF